MKANGTGFINLRTGNGQTDTAFRIALGDIYGNIVPFQDGLLSASKPVLLAGMDYDTPWTRDAAIQAWNGIGLFFPEVSKNTLQSVLISDNGKVRIGGEYWDAIIWVTGAWQQYLVTGDKEFLQTAFDASVNSIRYFEETEYDSSLGLFRGAACYGDGIAAYTDAFARTNKGSSSIFHWPANNPHLAAKTGEGLPMYALSTNCLYCHAYRLIAHMTAELGISPDPAWNQKAEKLKEAINAKLWNEQKGRYDYYLDPFGGCDAQEGLGQSFAILLEIADSAQAAAIMKNCFVTPAGMPCVWPSFSRYDTPGGQTFGRHSGTVWPHIQGFWADAAKRSGRSAMMLRELELMQKHACVDAHFSEMYHPYTEKPYGGVQEWQGPIVEWKPCIRQTWSATAFLRVILTDVFGMTFSPEGITFAPCVDASFASPGIQGLVYRNRRLDISITGGGERIERFFINGREKSSPFLAKEELEPEVFVRIDLAP